MALEREKACNEIKSKSKDIWEWQVKYEMEQQIYIMNVVLEQGLQSENI